MGKREFKILRRDFAGSRLAEDVNSQIKSHVLKPGDALPSISNLSERYNISYVTAYRAICKLAEQGIVIREPNRGTFVSQEAVLKNEEQKIQFVAFIMCECELNDPSYVKIFHAAEKEMAAYHYQIIYINIDIHNIDESRQRLKDTFKTVAGLLAIGMVTNKIMVILKESRLPFFVIGDIPECAEYDVPIVTIDTANAAYQAVKYLNALGHSRIALLNGPGHGHFQLLQSGYEKGLRESEIVPDDKIVISCHGTQAFDGYVATKELLRQAMPPSAIFAVNDRMAIGAWQAIEEQGLNVPEDMSLVGWGDLGLESGKFNTLTTIGGVGEEMGSVSSKRLVEMMKGGKPYPTTFIIPAKLIIRKSCQKLNKGVKCK